MDRTLALKGPISRGEPLQFRIAMDGLTENRRDVPLAKSRLGLALSQVGPPQNIKFCLNLAESCCDDEGWDVNLAIYTLWVLDALIERKQEEERSNAGELTKFKHAQKDGKPLSVGICSRCCIERHFKLAFRIATLFDIEAGHDFSSDQREQLQEIFASAITESGTAAGALHMLRLWPSLQRGGCSPNRVLKNLFDKGLSSLAVEWALEELGQEQQEFVLDLCLESNHLRSASRLARESSCLGQKARERLDQAIMAKLLDQGAWDPALARAGENKQLQMCVLEAMVGIGEVDHAQDLAADLGLKLSVDACMEQKTLERAAKFVGLPIPDSSVVFVNSGEGLATALEWLVTLSQRAEHGELILVGLDAEWAPDDLPGGVATTVEGNGDSIEVDRPSTVAPISILQVATTNQVFVLDIPALLSQESTRQQLSSLLNALAGPNMIKAGCGLSQDLSKLREADGTSRAFWSCLELQRLRSYMGGSLGRKTKQPVGLSAAAEAVLGKPLDKAIRLSNWARRPLSAMQLRYAALDALVSPLIIEKILERHPELKQPGRLRRLCAKITV